MYPDFLIIGAMKCATSTLQVQLAAQPGVFMTTPKEPNYFSNDEIFARGPEWYSALYKNAGENDLKGEASTHYTKLPTYPKTIERMAAIPKDPKLIYMIRNPVERAVSHYIHEWSEGRMGRDPIYAFEKHRELVEYGKFGLQITPYVKKYGLNNIFLTSLESMKIAPQAELARIGRFLELPEPLIWRSYLGAQNISSERMRRLPFHNLLIENPVAKTIRNALVPKSVRTRIRNARMMGDRPELSDSLRSRLENDFKPDHANLVQIFGDHHALRICYPFLQ